ncbi:MAG: hypothetical protein ACE5R6_13570 [Candidatus Heimdallarchaeota archaeon]
MTTKEGLIFDVKGVIHPPDRVIAYLRYIPDFLVEKNAFKERRKSYIKVYMLEEREKELRRRYPWYLYPSKCLGVTIQAVPHEQILQIHDPIEKFQKIAQSISADLDPLSKYCLDLGQAICSEAKIPPMNMGVSGSVLVDLHTKHSDIDLVVYGSIEGRRVYDLMTKLYTQTARIEGLSFYRDLDLRKLYRFRSISTPISFNDFVRVETKKVLQGLYKGYDFYIRLVCKPEDTGLNFGDQCFQDCGDVVLKARIANDSKRFFTPCIYDIEDVIILSPPQLNINIETIESFRGRFCDAARIGEQVRVQGKLEQITDQKTGRKWYRVLLGRDRRDFMVIEE